MNKELVIEEMESKGINSVIGGKVFNLFQELIGKDFIVLPEDKVYEVYGMAGDDIEDAISRVSLECGCKFPEDEDVAQIKITNVIDIAMAVKSVCGDKFDLKYQ